MSTLAFDTLKASRNLKAAGFSEAQADAIIGTVGDSFTDSVATKVDIAEVKTQIAEVRSELKQDIASTRTEIARIDARIAHEFKSLYRHIWLMAVGIVGTVLILGRYVF